MNHPDKAVPAWKLLLCILLPLALLWAGTARAADDYLAPEQAFQLSARMVDANTAELAYTIAPGYYMYRDRFHFTADGASPGEPRFPAGVSKFDDNFGKQVETYHQGVVVRLPVTAAQGNFTLSAVSQGCADRGLCYPPMTLKVVLSPQVLNAAVHGTTGDPALAAAGGSDIAGITAVLKGGKLWPILSLFFVLGIGLSFTPCVLPMLPILSSIIVGQQGKSADGRAPRARSFLLSVVYAVGMALVYTALGVAAGMLGEGLSAYLQNPWVLGAFALLMAVLSLAMFDFYQLQVPAAIQTRLSGVSSGGTWIGVFVMGAISALIVGPCVAAPLAGALLYISQSRDVVLGGSALFAMAAGMSVPLLLVGASAGALLPRAGAWMDGVKRFFGVMMLGTALWMVSPVIPAWLQVLGWAVLGIGYGAWLLWARPGHWISRGAGLAFAALGLLQLVNVATGGRDALAPLSQLAGRAQGTSAQTDFVRVRSVAELDAALAQNAKGSRLPVMLDFYADWCVSCKEMERFTFSDARVKARFAQMLLLQVDVTANNADDRALLKRFDLFGPPGTMFFDADGHEQPRLRVIGYQDAGQFLATLQGLSK